PLAGPLRGGGGGGGSKRKRLGAWLRPTRASRLTAPCAALPVTGRADVPLDRLTGETLRSVGHAQHRLHSSAVLNVCERAVDVLEVVEPDQPVERELPVAPEPDEPRDEPLRDGIALNDSQHPAAIRQLLVGAAGQDRHA